MTRREVKAGYARGNETEARILDVAIKLFGTKGFDSVSTREIADAASVPPASLRYYFKSKQGLYVACLVHIQTLSFPFVEPALEAAEKVLQEPQPDVERIIDAYCGIQEAQIDYSIGRPDAAATALFMLRHDLPSDSGVSNFTGGDGTIALRLLACFIQMMKVISGGMFDTQSALIVAGLINSQLTVMHLKRIRLAEMGWDLTNPERLRWLKETVRFNTSAMLRAYSAKHLAEAGSDAAAQALGRTSAPII